MNLKTWLRSKTITYLASEAFQARLRKGDKWGKAEVLFFHQVDDAHSHLAVQKLAGLQASYGIPFKMFLVSAPEPKFRGSDSHFDLWARQDALDVAAHYDTRFAPGIQQPSTEAILTANRMLANKLSDADFAATAVRVGEDLWRGQAPNLEAASEAATTQTLQTGNALRTKLGHYQGGMFYYGGEWYWGIDRIRLLEARLQEDGFGRSAEILVPEPEANTPPGTNAESITLEYYPSLRSPYTAIGHERVLAMIERTGVTVELKPVMPMLMRGIPAPRAKQRYIISDSAREGRAHGSPMGKIVDPFGEPVRKAFALFPGAQAQGKGMEFVTAYLDSAWKQGVDIASEAGLKQVAANAGLDWQALTASSDGWQSILESNLQEMMTANLWGVPSFKVRGGSKEEDYACWGQDRIWRVEREILSRIS